MIERIEINLLPAEYRVHRKKFKIKREIAYPLLFALVVGITLALWTLSLQNSIVTHKNEIKVLRKTIAQNRPIQKEINQLRNDKNVIQQKIQALELINVNREKWVLLMEEFSHRLPDYTWLVNLREEMRNPPIIKIEGRTHSFPEVANFMSNLEDCPYIQAVDLIQIEQVNSSKRIYSFSISCSINDNAYLTSHLATSEKGEPHL
jgi:Tfp pilus assembly protein PilN